MAVEIRIEGTGDTVALTDEAYDTAVTRGDIEGRVADAYTAALYADYGPRMAEVEEVVDMAESVGVLCRETVIEGVDWSDLADGIAEAERRAAKAAEEATLVAGAVWAATGGGFSRDALLVDREGGYWSLTDSPEGPVAERVDEREAEELAREYGAPRPVSAYEAEAVVSELSSAARLATSAAASLGDPAAEAAQRVSAECLDVLETACALANGLDPAGAARRLAANCETVSEAREVLVSTGAADPEALAAAVAAADRALEVASGLIRTIAGDD